MTARPGLTGGCALAYCGQCGMSVVGAFCGNCGARSSEAGGPAASPAVEPPPPSQPIAPVPPNELAEAYVSHPTVPFAVPEPDPVRLEPAPTVRLWAANPAAPPPFQPPPIQAPLVQAAPPSRRRSGGLVLAIVAGAVLLAGSGYAAAKLTILKDATAGSTSTQAAASVRATPTGIPAKSAEASPAIAPSPVAVPVTPTPTPTVDPAVAAKAELEALVAKDAARPTVRGQWVAQLSSKSEGIVDITLQPGPFTVPDILAEHLRLRSDPSYGSLVRLVHLGDWGSLATPASPMWVTVADINTGSSAEVTTWCQAHFSQRGKALNNVCFPRQLKLKSG